MILCVLRVCNPCGLRRLQKSGEAGVGQSRDTQHLSALQQRLRACDIRGVAGLGVCVAVARQCRRRRFRADLARNARSEACAACLRGDEAASTNHLRGASASTPPALNQARETEGGSAGFVPLTARVHKTDPAPAPPTTSNPPDLKLEN